MLEDKRIDLPNIGMRLKGEIDANIQVLSGNTTCTPEDRALWAEFSAQMLESETVKKMKGGRTWPEYFKPSRGNARQRV